MSSVYSLDGRNLLIAGADSAIGREFLIAAVEDGARCAALVRDSAGTDTLEGLVPSHRCFAADLLETSVAANATIEAIASLDGRIDGLVTCAGVFEHKTSAETDRETWQQVLDINLTSCFEIARECAGPMATIGTGSIVMVSSQIARTGHPRAAAYAAAKAGVNGLVRAMSLELASSGVRVNAVAPGPVVTPMTAAARSDAARVKKLLESVPMGRLGQPQEIAATIGFLLSDASSYITGQVLAVDGGISTN